MMYVLGLFFSPPILQRALLVIHYVYPSLLLAEILPAGLFC